LIGWHLNRGKDATADFFPASRFRTQFYRPDVIVKVFETLDEGEALRMANLTGGRQADAAPVLQNVLPPVVEILSPNAGTTASSSSVTLKYSARVPIDAPVIALRVRVNGQAVTLSDTRNLAVSATEGSRDVTIPIPSQDSEIQLFAENRNGTSTPAVLRLTWAGKSPEAKQAAQYQPRLYVLAVGVSKYANPDYNLGLAAKDATDLAAVFLKQKGKLYSDVQVWLLTDSKATRDDVVDGLEWLKREVTARDVGVMLGGKDIADALVKHHFRRGA